MNNAAYNAILDKQTRLWQYLDGNIKLCEKASAIGVFEIASKYKTVLRVIQG